jgi:transposase, IS5 family
MRSNKVNNQDLFTFTANDHYEKIVKTHSRSTLAMLNTRINWEALLAPIEKVMSQERSQSGLGRKPFSPLTIVKCFILQYMYGLSDSDLEFDIADRRSFQIFLDINTGDSIPDETTICRYRKTFADFGLDKLLFESLNKQLKRRNLILERVTVVDSTIIDAQATPGSGKDQDADFTSKGKKNYYGYKGHIGIDAGTGVIHSLEFTSARPHDSQMFDNLLTGNEKSVYADKGYANLERDKELESQGVTPSILSKAYRNRPLTKEQVGKNKQLSKVRNRVERPFAYMKRVLKYNCTSYYDLARNRVQFVFCSIIYNMRRLLVLSTS